MLFRQENHPETEPMSFIWLSLLVFVILYFVLYIFKKAMTP